MMNEIMLPVIALVGQKNVGKSTLFNRLTRTHAALVSNSYSGLTRDRKYGCMQYKQCKSIIIDTGGFNRLSNSIIQNYINNQTIVAIKEAYIILLIVNGQFKESSIDYDIINYLRKLEKNIFVVVNKIDNIIYHNKNYTVYDYYSLGVSDVIYISAMHGHGVDGLLERMFLKIPQGLYNNDRDRIFKINKNNFYDKNNKKKSLSNQFNSIKLAIVGRPNSGKSTFINYILKKNRMITSNIPGTTRDSIYIPMVYNNQKYVLIDTAGVRKRSKINDISEKISVSKTLQVIKTAHITLFMIDIHAGIVDQDLSLLRFISDNSKVLMVVINKYDTSSLIDIRNIIMQSLTMKKSFFNSAKVHFISSLYGHGINNLFKSIIKIYQSSIQTISTAQLTRIMYEAIMKYPPPLLSGTRITPKLKYVHIGGYNPPMIIIHGSKVSHLSDEYRKYLKNYFYRSLNINGILIRIQFKDNTNPFIHK